MSMDWAFAVGKEERHYPLPRCIDVGRRAAVHASRVEVVKRWIFGICDMCTVRYLQAFSECPPMTSWVCSQTHR